MGRGRDPAACPAWVFAYARPVPLAFPFKLPLFLAAVFCLAVASRGHGQPADASAELAAAIRECSIRIENSSGESAAAGLLLSDDGYFISKASELPKWDALKFFSPDGKPAVAREIRREPRLDLVLGQLQMAKKPAGPRFGDSRIISLGQWLAAGKNAGREVKLGVMSAKRRPVGSRGVGIGIRMDDGQAGRGVVILDVGADSPAESAGLKKNDRIIKANGMDVEKPGQFRELVGKCQPGDEIEIVCQRDGGEVRCMVRLASMSKIQSNFTGEDFANGGTSIRTDDFPEVIQHDIPLDPADMGGPLCNLLGQVVGINIARVDRVATFALPVERFLPEARKWIEQDRHPPKASPR